MSIKFTQGSAMEYETILYGKMTPGMAAEYLKEERVSVRSFSQTLRKMYSGMDLEKRLSVFYRDLQPEIKLSSINRKIGNWLSDRNLPSRREDYFCIAFALGLSEEQLAFLLGMCTDYTIQYRNGREAVLAWFLRNGKKYTEAVGFLSDVSGTVKENVDSQEWETGGISVRSEENTENTGQNCQNYPKAHECMKTKGGIKTSAEKKTTGEEADITRITQEIRDEFRLVHGIEELRACYLRNRRRFGQLHVRAYYYFDQYLKLLSRPSSSYYKMNSIRLGGAEKEEPDYSIDAVMNTYLSMRMPLGKKLSRYSLVQRLIKENWPSATSIKNIRNQIDDVPRKLLLLLYVVTEDSGFYEDYRESDEEYVTLEERVEDHWWTLGGMLADCGMAPLDLRNVFDWLIFYAIAADGEETMSSRLEKVLAELYENVC